LVSNSIFIMNRHQYIDYFSLLTTHKHFFPPATSAILGLLLPHKIRFSPAPPSLASSLSTNNVAPSYRVYTIYERRLMPNRSFPAQQGVREW
jgi:hypothetical protein